MTRPAVAAFVPDQLRASGREAGGMERMAAQAADAAALAAAIGRLRQLLAAHVVVEERLLVSPLRGREGYRELLRLEGEHDTLAHRAAELQARGCPVPEVAALGRTLRAHIEEERRVVRSASVAARDRLAEIPAWRAAELFACAGGPTDIWPEEWLG